MTEISLFPLRNVKYQTTELFLFLEYLIGLLVANTNQWNARNTEYFSNEIKICKPIPRKRWEDNLSRYSQKQFQ